MPSPPGVASPGAANGSQKKPSKRQQNARKCAHHAPFFGAASLPLPIATLADPDPNPNPCLAARRKTWRDLGDNNRVKLVQQALGAEANKYVQQGAPAKKEVLAERATEKYKDMVTPPPHVL